MTRSRKRAPSRRVLAAAGAGWSVWYPVDRWAMMTNEERSAVQIAQARLLSPPDDNETRQDAPGRTLEAHQV